MGGKLICIFVDDPAQLQPGQVPPNQSTFYDVVVQPYRGIPLDDNWKTRPDVVTVRIHQAIQQQGGQVAKVNRDLISVECKAPSKDQPSEWKNVMNKAVKRLDMTHRTISLFLILNVGLKWLIFYWNPTNPAVAGQHLRIINAAGTETWDVDPRIHAPPGINGDHIDQNNVIHATRAKSLDCFSLTQQAGGLPVLAYQNDLNFLENCVNVMMNHQGYVGWNNPEFV